MTWNCNKSNANVFDVKATLTAANIGHGILDKGLVKNEMAVLKLSWFKNFTLTKHGSYMCQYKTKMLHSLLTKFYAEMTWTQSMAC